MTMTDDTQPQPAKPYRGRAEQRRLHNTFRAEEIARKRAERAAIAIGGQLPKSEPKDRAAYVRKKTSIEWLLDKKKLKKPQAAIASRYNAWFRGAGIEGAESLKSSLDDSVRGTDKKGGLILDFTETAEWLADCRAKVLRAHAALHDEERMVATLIAIAGKGLYPTDITRNTHRVEEIEDTLRNALNLLLAYERSYGRF